jgi:D-alanine-D-alanine ligase
MQNKLKVTILFGGRSAEHDVSVQSAKNILAAINRDKYDVKLIGIDRLGKWHLTEAAALLHGRQQAEISGTGHAGSAVIISPGDNVIGTQTNRILEGTDVVFPVLHGSNGEDGSIQGMLKILDVPFVGPGILSSAICMDKEATKRMLLGSGIKVARHVVYEADSPSNLSYDEIVTELGLPFFIKPSSLGSSIGVHKVTDEAAFEFGLADALQFDKKILLEENITGREIECAVLGNADPEPSVPGEIIPNTDFYSYESKYIDENGAILQIPAELSPELTAKIQALAKKIFKLLYCEGMARVDFFLTPAGEIILNEVNTIPGFTRISMYPKLWEITGLDYTGLIDRLIELAIERHQRNAGLKFSY